MSTIDLIGSKVIESNTNEYSKYILTNQFPSVYDGFKKIRRRLIWSLKEEKGNFSGLSLKSKTGKIHPYGDASIYETAVKMSQSFQTPFLFFELQGDSGTYSGDAPASVRYVKFKISDFTKDMFLKDIDLNAFSMEQTEDLLGLEPSYLIPKLPTTLLFSNNTIGYGSKSLTVGYPINVICDMVIEYSLYKEKIKDAICPNWDFSKFYKLLIPIFPVNNRILNPIQIEKEYKKENFTPSVIVEGDIKILNQNTIMIMNIPYYNSIINIKKDLINILRNKNNPLSNEIVSLDFLADNETDAKILIRFKKTTDIFDMIKNIKSKIKFRSIITPFPNYVKDNKIIKMDHLQLLEEWYNKRYFSIFGKKRKQQRALLKRKNQLLALLIVTENPDRIIQIIKTYDEDKSIRLLMKEFKLSFYQSKFIKNSKIGIISKADRKKLKKEYESVEFNINELLKSFNFIHKDIREDAKYFKKKYKMPDHCSYVPKYIGAFIVLGKGICNFESYDELYKLISIFKKLDMKIIKYPSKIRSIFLFKNGKSISVNTDILLSKYEKSEYLIINQDKKYTIATDGKYHLRAYGIHYIPNKHLLYINKKHIFGLDYKGHIDLININDIPERKPSQQGNKTDYIYYWDKLIPDTKYILITHSSKQNSKITMHMINSNTKKIITYAGGTTTPLGIFKEDEKNIFIQLPNKAILHIDSMDKYIINKRKKDIPIAKFNVIK